MQPHTGLGRDYRMTEKMASRGCPPRIGKFPPHEQRRLAFTFRKVSIAVARECDGRKAVGLRAKESVMLLRPFMQRSEIALIRQFRQRPSPIMAHSGSQRPIVAHQRRQIRSQIVSASRPELRHQVASPVGSIVFQAIAEDCIRRLGAKSLEQPISHRMKMILDSIAIIVVEHETLGTNRRALDGHSRAAGYEEHRAGCFRYGGAYLQAATDDRQNSLCLRQYGLAVSYRDEKCRNQ